MQKTALGSVHFLKSINKRDARKGLYDSHMQQQLQQRFEIHISSEEKVEFYVWLFRNKFVNLRPKSRHDCSLGIAAVFR